jgi:hypothetical protein
MDVNTKDTAIARGVPYNTFGRWAKENMHTLAYDLGLAGAAIGGIGIWAWVIWGYFADPFWGWDTQIKEPGKPGFAHPAQC